MGCFRLCLCMVLIVLVGCESFAGVRRTAPFVGDVNGKCVAEELEHLYDIRNVEHRIKVASPHPPESADGHTDLLLYTTHGHAVYLTITRTHGQDVRYSSEIVLTNQESIAYDLSSVRNVMVKVEKVIQEKCGVDFAQAIVEECIGFECL